MFSFLDWDDELPQPPYEYQPPLKPKTESIPVKRMDHGYTVEQVASDYNLYCKIGRVRDVGVDEEMFNSFPLEFRVRALIAGSKDSQNTPVQ